MLVAEKIRQLYALPSVVRDVKKRKNNFGYSHTIDEFIENVEKQPPVDFSLKSLESLKPYEPQLALSILLAHLPAKLVCKELGNETLLWTFLNYAYENETRRNLKKGIEKETGIDSEKFEQARLAAWKVLGPSKLNRVLEVYKLREQLQKSGEQPASPELLKNNVKGEIILSEERLKDYQVCPIETEEFFSNGYVMNWRFRDKQQFGNRRYALWLDCPLGFIIKYKKEPNAIIGLFPDNDNSIRIHQLQGVRAVKVEECGEIISNERGSARGLMVLDWQKLCVEIAEDLARKNGYSRIIIQSGHNNPWTRPYRGEKAPRFPLDKALESYDGLAERLGFQQGEYQDWHKQL